MYGAMYVYTAVVLFCFAFRVVGVLDEASRDEHFNEQMPSKQPLMGHHETRRAPTLS